MSKLMPKTWGKEEVIVYLMKGALGGEVLEQEVVAFEGLVRKYEVENFLDLDGARDNVTDFVEECFENGTFVIDKPGLLSDVMFDLADEVILWAKDNLSKEDIGLLVNAIVTIMIQDKKIDIGESRLLKSVMDTFYDEGTFDDLIAKLEGQGLTIESNFSDGLIIEETNLDVDSLSKNQYWETAEGIIFDDWDDWTDWLTKIMVLRRKLNPTTLLVQLLGVMQQGDMVMVKSLMKLSTTDQLDDNFKGALAEGGQQIIDWFEAIRQENKGCINFDLMFTGDESSPMSGVVPKDDDEYKWTFLAALLPDNSFKITWIHSGDKEYEVPLMGAEFAKESGLPANLFTKNPTIYEEEDLTEDEKPEPKEEKNKKKTAKKSKTTESKPKTKTTGDSIEDFRAFMASEFDGMKLPKGKTYCEYPIGIGMQVTCMVKKKGIAVYFYSGGKMKAKKLFELINASGLAGKTINEKYTLIPMPGAKNPNIVRMDLLIETNGLALNNSDLRHEVKDVFGQLLDLCKPLGK
ncbi:MAG: hypothetical protein HN601_01880 [Candidatus Marinimicrobia bacterium]|nr:hypothetical protein [Candidatus Neomarinimicrobiota bacterium]